MDSTETESIEHQCEKLKDIARVKVEYFDGEEIKFLLGFECDRGSDCGIRISLFSGSPIYTVDCPLYNDLENNLSWRTPS